MNSKNFLTSTTIQGIIVAGIGFVVMVMKMFGKSTAADALQANQTDILQLVAVIGTAIGLVVAIYGRFKTDGKVLTLGRPNFVILLILLLGAAIAFNGCANPQVTVTRTNSDGSTIKETVGMPTLCMDWQGSGIQMNIDPCGVTTIAATNVQNNTNVQAIQALAGPLNYVVGVLAALKTNQPIPAPPPEPNLGRRQ
jgi:hypothetical protein